MTEYIALTAYGVPIPKHLNTMEAVRFWARTQGIYFPGSKVIRKTAKGIRTVWKS